MYLKSLKIAGFKSFADRTRLEFEPGVTVVVGPNGSGKSNIVDAIAWVMGTQSTKSLRTERMEDVIFAGTATRPALGRAEVSLIFDNAERRLPLDMPEVTVTRRLYRDGSSDYEINGVGCRLLDLQELLADSGVGRHQHVVVGQGQLDAILNAKPDEHRAVIEEAAGILKHRLRKDRAIRRLERTDADVLRLLDITKELQRQLRPLKRQAADAERHEGLRSEVRALRLWLGGEELRRIGRRLAEVASEESATSGRISESELELAGIEAALDDLSEAAGEAGRALERDTAAAARLETTAERLRSVAQVSAERRRGMAARLEGAGERQADLEREAEELAVDLAVAQAREQEAAVEAERAERRLTELEDEERSLAEQEQMPTEGAVAMLRGDMRALHAAAERDRRETVDVSARIEQIAEAVARDTAEIDRLRSEIESTDAEVGVVRRTYDEAVLTRSRDQEAWEDAEDTGRAAALALAGASARVEALEGAVAGVADPAARRRIEDAEGAQGPLAAALDIPPELAAAVDAALGPWSDAIAMREATLLGEAVAGLKSEGIGGIPMVTSVEMADVPAREISTPWGLDALVDLLGPAADLELAAALLGDVVVAEGWAAAWEIVRHHPGIRIVTPEGDLIAAHGVRVAHPDGATPAMLEAARADREAAERDGARARSRSTSARRAFDGSRAAERAALEALEAVEARLAGATEALDRLSRARASLQEEAARLESRRTALIEAAGSRAEQLARLEERLAALEGEEAERQRAWEELAARRQEVARRREETRRERQDVAAALGAVVERRAMLERRLLEVRAELEELETHPVEPAQIDHLAAVEQHARASLEEVRAHIQTLRERQILLREEAGVAGSRLTEARNRREDLHATVASAKDRLSALAVEAAELRVRHESVAEALRRDADASEEEALMAAPPATDAGMPPADRLAALEGELRRMGPVNPLAAQEYRELRDRHEFMAEQLDDLDKARGELKKVIRALDEKIVEMFETAFAEVAGFYEEHFGILFPGGRGKITLTDPDDPLNTGVDIKAQPLGKKVSRLQLLSGGERSLAALAFLFAVFKARPSPFYIMDEVEAALDDANLRRFLRLVDDFRASAQLVIVTHQQQTMEAADILYGVTMEPGGSSQVLAKRITGQLAYDEA